MNRAARRAGIVAGVAGLVAAGAAVGLAAERYAIGRIRGAGPDEAAGEPFGRLPADRIRTVHTEDSIPLHVEEVGPAGAPLTVVFVHGYALSMGSWHFQRIGLPDMRNPRIRMVFYDQPGHGRSGRLPAGEYNLEALGHALHRVIETVAPTGPLVLVGHSMGGMTIMALAENHPELFTERVVGVAFLNTSAGNLDEVTFGLPDMIARIRRPLMPMLTGVNRLTPTMVERARRVSSDLAWLLTRRYGFGSENPSAALVSYVEEMNSRTSVDVIVGYLRTLFEHLRHDALATLEGIETLVVGGEKDLITPKEHSEEIARLLPGAELVIIPDGGHVALMEYHEEVTDHLVSLLTRASKSHTTNQLAVARRARRRPGLFWRRRAQ